MRSRTRWARTPRARVCRILLVAASFAMSAVVGSPCWGGVPEPPPSQWQLYQNDPEPFCGSTRIMFAVPQAAHLQLTVKNSDATQVVRQLVNMDGMAGLYTVIWDGLDGDGNGADDRADGPVHDIGDDHLVHHARSLGRRNAAVKLWIVSCRLLAGEADQRWRARS